MFYFLLCVLSIDVANMVMKFRKPHELQIIVSNIPKFTSSVASGDPRQDKVILWTRVDNYIGTVHVVVSKDSNFNNPLKYKTSTTADVDFIVKVDIINLTDNTIYYYKFVAAGVESPVGRTKTLPKDAKHLKIAIASCANYPYGHFVAYSAMVALKAELLVFLGDYIYEYRDKKYGSGNFTGRLPKPNYDLITLNDYRTRHLQYKRDPDLQYMHKNIPIIAVWDDHEFANNAWANGSRDHSGIFLERKTAAARAYFEYIPIRLYPEDLGSPIYRKFEVGNLFELIMLDTRIYRDVTDTFDPRIVKDPTRTILGKQQEKWLDELPTTNTSWSLYGNQVMFAVILQSIHEMGFPFIVDGWDAYYHSRKRMISYIHDRKKNTGSSPVIISGDIHVSVYNKIQEIPEIITPAIASLSIESQIVARSLETLLRTTRENIWSNMHDKGFVLFDIYNEHIDVQWIHVTARTEIPDHTYQIGHHIRLEKS